MTQKNQNQPLNENSLKKTIVSLQELENIMSDMTKISKVNKLGLNEYDAYIKLMQEKRNNSQGIESRMEKHHILPRFEGGDNSNQNRILLTVKEHVIAHWIRYKSLNKTQDLAAYLFRIGDTNEALKLRDKNVKAAREKDRESKLGFFDSKFQTKMGQRGGPIGGSADTESQFLARQKVGLTYGRITGIGNQKDKLREFVSSFSIWAFSLKAKNEPYSKDRGEEFYSLLSPKESFVEVVSKLKEFRKNRIEEGKNIATMHKLVYKQRNNMFGWRIVKTLTCSEAVEGIKTFISDLSLKNEILHFNGLEEA